MTLCRTCKHGKIDRSTGRLLRGTILGTCSIFRNAKCKYYDKGKPVEVTLGSPTFRDFQMFVAEFKLSAKIRLNEAHVFSLKDFYKYLSRRSPFTPKRKQETAEYRRWLLGVARPLMRSILQVQWEQLGINPMIGREGFIEVFTVKNWVAPVE